MDISQIYKWMYFESFYLSFFCLWYAMAKVKVIIYAKREFTGALGEALRNSRSPLLKMYLLITIKSLKWYISFAILTDRCREPSYQGSDNKESMEAMEGPGAKSNNKQQFNDCHDASAGPSARSPKVRLMSRLSPDTDTSCLAGDHSPGLILFLFLFDLWLIWRPHGPHNA